MKAVFKVNANHVAREYAHSDETVTAEYSPHFGWSYWGRLGCGKSYVTPEEAIDQTLRAHGCTNIRMRRVTADEEDREYEFNQERDLMNRMPRG